MDLWIRIVILAVLGYALGNWSMARMIAWNLDKRHVDISQHGSGNPGTMNMIRKFGYKWGILTLILDVVKGAVPAALGGFLLELGLNTGGGFYYSQLGVYIGGLAVIVGHMFPVVFKFKGGKGVACGIGVFLAAHPLIMLAVFAVAFVVFVVFEYGFIASLTCIFSMTVIEYIMFFTGEKKPHTIAVAVLIGAIFLLIFIAHRVNFKRLLSGTESKLSLRDTLRKHKQKKLAEKADAGAGEKTEESVSAENPGNTVTPDGANGKGNGTE